MAAKKKSSDGFKSGDYVVYPTHGVGRVSGVEKETIAGTDLRLIVVNFDRDRMTLRVPMEKMEASGLRKLSTKKVMDDVVVTLKGRARLVNQINHSLSGKFTKPHSSVSPANSRRLTESRRKRRPRS
jgi:RNA polymerase-interacting CarD/CdnL/TRCF family regulator